MTILFVCTGNTCRSPMAACMMNHLFRQAGMTDAQALSAGVAAWDGQPASAGAKHAMEKRGLSLSTHQARMVTQELLDKADLVICVGERHAQALCSRFSPVPEIRCFSPAIPDPFGGSNEVYEACAAAMETQLRDWIRTFQSR